MLSPHCLKINLLLFTVFIIALTKFTSASTSEKFQASEAKPVPLSPEPAIPSADLPTEEITAISVKNDQGLQTRIIPKLVDSLKYVYNYMVTPRLTGTSKSEESAHGLTQVFGIFAFITFFSFILFVLQPLVTYPKRRRQALSQGRRFKHYFSPGYPYNPWSFSRKSKGYRYSGPAVSYYTSPSEYNPVRTVAPGAGTGSFPVISAFPATGPSSIVYSTNHEGTQASTQQVRTINKNKAPKALKHSPPKPHEEQLTKEEILYILKTLDDEE